jgi:hypothetical protein
MTFTHQIDIDRGRYVKLPVIVFSIMVILLFTMTVIAITFSLIFIKRKMTVNTREQLFIKKIADAQAIGVELPESLAMLTRDLKTSKVMPNTLAKTDKERSKLTRYASTDKCEHQVDECIVESQDIDNLKRCEKQPRSQKSQGKLLFHLPSEDDSPSK